MKSIFRILFLLGLVYFPPGIEAQKKSTGQSKDTRFVDMEVHSLYPLVAEWKSAVWQEGENFSIPVLAAEPPSLALAKKHATRSEEDTFFAVAPAKIALTGIKQSEEGNDILEFPVKEAATPAMNGKNVTVKLKPNEIVTLEIKL